MRSNYQRSISLGRTQKWGAKRLGFIFGYILITAAPITTMLTAAERGKDYVFLGIGVRIYQMKLRFL